MTVSILVEYLYPDSTEWSIMARTTYTYNNNQLLSEDLYETRNVDFNTWENNSRKLYTYNTTEFPATEINEIWTNGAWIPLIKNEKTYNLNNSLEERITSNWDTLTSGWLTYKKYQYTYDSDGILANVLSEKFIDGQWVYDDELNYFYTDFNKIAETSEPLDSASTILGTRTRYYYDADEKLINKVRESLLASAEDWRPVLQYNYLNNPDGSVNSFVRQVNMGADSVYWINFGRLSYFYLSPNSIEREDQQTFELFPNPTNDLVYIRTEGNFNPEYYKIINLEGKTILSGSLNALNAAISMSGIPAGIYLVELSRGDKVELGKIFKY